MSRLGGASFRTAASCSWSPLLKYPIFESFPEESKKLVWEDSSVKWVIECNEQIVSLLGSSASAAV